MLGNNCSSAASGWETSLSVFETVPDLYLIISVDLRIITASDAFLKQASLFRPDIKGKSVEDFYGKETGISSEDLTDSLRWVLLTGEQHGINYLRYDPFTRNMPAAEAEDRYWTVSNTPVQDESGKVCYIIHKVADASEQIRYYRELEELRGHNVHLRQQKHYMAVVENIPDVVTRWNKDLQLIYANAAFESKAGFCYEALLGKTAMDMGPKEHAIPFMEKMREVFEDGQPRTHFTPISGPGGEMCFYSRLVPEKDEHGNVKSILRIARDITDLKQTEQKLKESRDLLQAVFDESPNAINVFKIIFTEAGDVEDFEFFMANHVAVNLTGDKDLIGKRFTKEFPTIFTNAIFDRYRVVALTGEPADFEQWYEGEGIRRWFHFVASKVDNLLVITTEDISKRKYDELALTEGKELLHSVIDASVSTISVRKAVRDKQGKIIDFEWVLLNEQAKSYWNGRDLIGERQSVISPDSQGNGVFEKFVHTVESGLAQTFEQDFDVDGKVNWVMISIARLHDGLIISSMDITGRKLADQQLKQNNDLLKSIFNSSVLGVCVYKSVRDAQAKIIDFEFLLTSPLTEKLMGRGNLTGMRLLKMYPGVRETGLFDKMVAVVDQNLSLDETGELAYLGQAGTWVRRRSIKMEDGLITSWLDISKQKNAEQQLVKQYRILKQAEEVAAIGSWEFEIPENKMRWSDGMFDLFGLEKEAYIYPELYLKYIIPEDKPRMKDIIRFIKQEFKPFQDEVTLKIRGQKRIFRIKASVSTGPDGKPVKVSGVAMDITERTETAQKMKQIEENRFKDILHAVISAQEEERAHIAGVLHNEFGQLLSVAKMKIGADNPEAAELVNQAIVQVRHISYDLMPDILADFGLEFALKDMCSKKLTDAGIKYSVKITGLVTRIKPLMEVAIYRIVQELLNNTIKHSKADFIVLEVIRQGSLLQVRLADNGVGFYLPKITDKSNAGFGLKYILNRIHLHKGHISIATKGKGTEFSIEIPLSDRERTADNSPEIPKGRSSASPLGCAREITGTR